MGEKSTSKRCSKVLVVPPSERLPSFQIGIRQPFKELQRQGIIEYKVMAEYEVTKHAIADADLIVFLRNTTKEAYEHLITAQRLGKRTVYSIDDHFLHLPKRGFGIVMEEQERRDTFVLFLRKAQTIRVSSHYFAEHIKQNYNDNVVCILGSVDFRLISRAGNKTRSNQELMIGYGGSYKEDDFAAVTPALLKILEEYTGKVRLEFHGFIPAELLHHPRIVYFVGGYEYQTYLQFLYQRAWDIGIAPLADSLYNKCKSNNKFREYSACGIPGVYSAIPTYSDTVRHEETGLLVNHSTDDWYRGLKRMIEDKRLRRHIRKQAFQSVQERYTIARCAEDWRTQIFQAKVELLD